MKRTKEGFTRDAQVETNISGCREFEGEDLSTTIYIQSMIQENSFSRTNKKNGWINKCSRKDKGKNKKNYRIVCMINRLYNSTE